MLSLVLAKRKEKNMDSPKHNIVVLGQIVKCIPAKLIEKAEEKA